MSDLLQRGLHRARHTFARIGLKRTFRASFDRFAALSGTASRFPIRWEDRNLQLYDATATTGFDPHYTYHPAWAGRVLAAENPARHVDISSTLQFVGIASAFVPIDFYDYRPANLILPNLTTAANDLTRLTFADDSIPSLSCMHTLEHVGLGRYGDPLDPDGDLKAAKELARVLAPGGLFIFVTPVGRSRICYNAHRVYAYEQAVGLFPSLTVEKFSLLPDDYSKGFVDNASPSLVNAQNYGCGCFAFRKPRP